MVLKINFKYFKIYVPIEIVTLTIAKSRFFFLQITLKSPNSSSRKKHSVKLQFWSSVRNLKNIVRCYEETRLTTTQPTETV